jgi:hypothetical protein
LLRLLPRCIAIGFIATPILLLTFERHQRNVSNLWVLIGCAMEFMLSGGLLIFIVPVWVSLSVAAIGIGVSSYYFIFSHGEEVS